MKESPDEVWGNKKKFADRNSETAHSNGPLPFGRCPHYEPPITKLSFSTFREQVEASSQQPRIGALDSPSPFGRWSGLCLHYEPPITKSEQYQQESCQSAGRALAFQKCI